jgi:pimeloyl-ACP methyl ester carboxylesterase
MPPLLSLFLLLLLAGAIASAGAVWVMARGLVRPPRMTDAKALYLLKRISPTDLGMAFEEVSFTVRDEHTGLPLKLAAWWIPHPQANGRCAVLIHGYADAKVGAIAWAPTWHALGFNLLAIDLRAHGESGGDTCTAGFFERHDLAAVVGQLRATRPGDAKQVVLFGISLGSSTALGAAALGGGVADAVVLDSPIADFRTAALTHFDLLGLPGRVFQRLALRLAERMTGANFRAVAPLEVIADVSCPVMLVAPADDVFVTPIQFGRLEEIIRARNSYRDLYWRAVGTRHLEALYADPETYRARLGAFLDAALQNGPAAGETRNTLPAAAP